MKLKMGLFVLMLVISSALSLPAGNPNDDAELINTSNISENSSQDDVETNFKNFQGVVDTGVGDPYYTYTFNPYSFFDYFQDTLRRLRDGIERKIWAQAEADKDLLPLDATKPNSTSVVEVIDGHKIEINETVYSNNNDGNAVFKVRIIQIRPLDLEDDNLPNEDTNIENMKPNKEFEGANDDDDVKETPKIDNEINRSDISSESFLLHDNNSEPEQIIYSTILPNLNLSQNDDINKMIVEENLNMKNYEILNETNFYTIIDQIEENEKLQKTDSQLLINENDENIDESTMQYETTTGGDQNIFSENLRESLETDSSEEEDKTEDWNSEWETLEDNDIEKFSPIEIDLSNDIFVNDILADQSATHEPEAEVFSHVIINFKDNNSEISKAINVDESLVPGQNNFTSIK